MSDKDLMERGVLKELVPNAVLLICCIIHVEILNEISQLNIWGLHLIKDRWCTKLVYSSSECAYQLHYQELLDKKLKTIIDHFSKNWHDIWCDWVKAWKMMLVIIWKEQKTDWKVLIKRLKVLYTRIPLHKYSFKSLCSGWTPFQWKEITVQSKFSRKLLLTFTLWIVTVLLPVIFNTLCIFICGANLYLNPASNSVMIHSASLQTHIQVLSVSKSRIIWWNSMCH